MSRTGTGAETVSTTSATTSHCKQVCFDRAAHSIDFDSFVCFDFQRRRKIRSWHDNSFVRFTIFVKVTSFRTRSTRLADLGFWRSRYQSARIRHEVSVSQMNCIIRALFVFCALLSATFLVCFWEHSKQISPVHWESHTFYTAVVTLVAGVAAFTVDHLYRQSRANNFNKELAINKKSQNFCWQQYLASPVSTFWGKISGGHTPILIFDPINNKWLDPNILPLGNYFMTSSFGQPIPKFFYGCSWHHLINNLRGQGRPKNRSSGKSSLEIARNAFLCLFFKHFSANCF